MTTTDTITAFHAALAAAGLTPVNQSAEFGEVWSGDGITAVLDLTGEPQGYLFSGGWDDHDSVLTEHHRFESPAEVALAADRVSIEPYATDGMTVATLIAEFAAVEDDTEREREIEQHVAAVERVLAEQARMDGQEIPEFPTDGSALIIAAVNAVHLAQED